MKKISVRKSLLASGVILGLLNQFTCVQCMNQSVDANRDLGSSGSLIEIVPAKSQNNENPVSQQTEQNVKKERKVRFILPGHTSEIKEEDKINTSAEIKGIDILRIDAASGIDVIIYAIKILAQVQNLSIKGFDELRGWIKDYLKDKPKSSIGETLSSCRQFNPRLVGAIMEEIKYYPLWGFERLYLMNPVSNNECQVSPMLKSKDFDPSNQDIFDYKMQVLGQRENQRYFADYLVKTFKKTYKP